MRKLVAVLLAILVLPIASPADAGERSSDRFPAEIDLPPDFFPEGITIGQGSTFYVGSLADGTIYRGDVRTGEGAVLTDPVGSFATIGLDLDRFGRIWVAGGITGTARVYDGRSGELLATYQLTGELESFINDVIISRNAAWFTDSGTTRDPDPSIFQFAGEPRLYKIPLGPGKRLLGPEAVEEIPVDVPDLGFPNLNGIETTPDRRGLIVAHTEAGALFRVDPESGSSNLLDVGMDFIGADGLVRKGRKLYVVENGAARIAEVQLDRRATTGDVRRLRPVEGSESPTTAALYKRSLYVADARFQSMTGPYKIFRVPLR